MIQMIIMVKDVNDDLTSNVLTLFPVRNVCLRFFRMAAIAEISNTGPKQYRVNVTPRHFLILVSLSNKFSTEL